MSLLKTSISNKSCVVFHLANENKNENKNEKRRHPRNWLPLSAIPGSKEHEIWEGLYKLRMTEFLYTYAKTVKRQLKQEKKEHIKTRTLLNKVSAEKRQCLDVIDRQNDAINAISLKKLDETFNDIHESVMSRLSLFIALIALILTIYDFFN